MLVQRVTDAGIIQYYELHIISHGVHSLEALVLTKQFNLLFQALRKVGGEVDNDVQQHLQVNNPHLLMTLQLGVSLVHLYVETNREQEFFTIVQVYGPGIF